MTQQGELPEEEVWPEQRWAGPPGSPEPPVRMLAQCLGPAGQNPCDPHHHKVGTVPSPSHPRGGSSQGEVMRVAPGGTVLVSWSRLPDALGARGEGRVEIMNLWGLVKSGCSFTYRRGAWG